MPRFVFRLQPVLGVRRRREEAAQKALAEAAAHREVCEQSLAETRRLLGKALEENAGEGFDLNTGLYLDCYRDCLNRRSREQLRVLARCEREVEEKRRRVIRARRERMVLERLKEKRFQAFRAGLAARETRELDDLGTRSFQFRRKGGE